MQKPQNRLFRPFRRATNLTQTPQNRRYPKTPQPRNAKQMQGYPILLKPQLQHNRIFLFKIFLIFNLINAAQPHPTKTCLPQTPQNPHI